MNNQEPDLQKILRNIKDLFFKDHNITLMGKFVWLPVNEKQSQRHLKKFGKELKYQRRKFQITETYEKVDSDNDSGESKTVGRFLRFYHLLISDINLDDMTFYIIGDNCVGPLVGEKIRYKFHVTKDYLSFTLLEKVMIAIR